MIHHVQNQPNVPAAMERDMNMAPVCENRVAQSRRFQLSSDAMAKPAEIVIRRFGGADAVAVIVGLSASRVYRWTRPRARGGTDGLIPARYQPVLLAAARARGIRLTPAELVLGQPAEPERTA